MLAPTNKTTLQAFLGLVSYDQLCIPKMYGLRAPLKNNNLLMKYTKWDWTNESQKAFDGLKKRLTSELSLTHFGPK